MSRHNSHVGGSIHRPASLLATACKIGGLTAELSRDNIDAVNAFGGSGFKTLPNNATVSIQMDNSTKYETYMKVLDQIMLGLNHLRDSLCVDKFNVPFSKLNDKVESDKQKISAIRQVYPKKIMKEKNRSVQ